MADKLIYERDLVRRTGLTPEEIRAAELADELPKRRQLIPNSTGPNATGWLEDELDRHAAWLEQEARRRAAC